MPKMEKASQIWISYQHSTLIYSKFYILSSNYSSISRHFHLTCAIAHACVSTRANLSARTICRTHEKSYSAEKVLLHRIFQSFHFCLRAPSLNNVVHVNSVSQALSFFALVMLNFFLLYQYTITNFVKGQLFLSYFVVMADQFSSLDTCANHTQNRSHLRFTACMLF